MEPGMVDRLMLTKDRIAGMAEGIRQVAALPDPVGEVTSMKQRPNGLMIGWKKVPLGVIGMIYESRPNVTADAFSLCFKAGNVVILRGGSDAVPVQLCDHEGHPDSTGRDGYSGRCSAADRRYQP